MQQLVATTTRRIQALAGGGGELQAILGAQWGKIPEVPSGGDNSEPDDGSGSGKGIQRNEGLTRMYGEEDSAEPGDAAAMEVGMQRGATKEGGRGIGCSGWWQSPLEAAVTQLYTESTVCCVCRAVVASFVALLFCLDSEVVNTSKPPGGKTFLNNNKKN
jgi:hypothetical protein